MEKIALPKIKEIKKGKESNQGIVSIGPCYPGYGITIGNSLRRVLLSSLPGAAVVGVKIKGVDHEFATIDHVKEDVLEIILNLKQLRVKVLSDIEEEIKLKLDVHGKKQVKASDIEKDSNVEIINKDLEIATITDMAGSLNVEIFVKKGKGYRPVEDVAEKKNEIGYMEMDAVFSPIVSVGINNFNVRVGDKTDWDQVDLEIVTDGTIDIKDAFNQSVEILIDQFSALVDSKKSEKKEKTKKEDKEEDKKEKAEKKTKEKKEKTKK
jgi:DNA-directed RNA polymerase subunit alpha